MTTAETATAPRQNPFPDAEYDRRLRNVRHAMTRRDLDALLLTTPENVMYLTGYQTFGSASQFLVVTHHHEPHFVLRELEAPLVDVSARFRSHRVFRDADDPLPLVADALRSLLSPGSHIGVERGWRSLTVTTDQRLSSLLNDHVLVDGSGAVESCRVVKSAAELRLCRQAAAITAAGITAAADAVAAGATENDVAAASAEAMIKAGSEWFAASPIVTSGPRSGVPHTTFARRRLNPGDTVLLEFGACLHRHFAPLMRSCVVGEADGDVARAYATCQQALEAAIAAIRPGVTSHEAHQACQDVIDAAGYTDWFKKRLGYSVGTGFSSWSESHIFDLKPGDERVIEEGMVFHMPPALRCPNVFGVGLSETITVTSDGAEPLADLSRELLQR